MALLRSLALLLLASCAAAVELMVERSTPRCVTETLHAQGIALINWEADGKVALKVYYPNGTLWHDVAAVAKDHLGFQAKEEGDYKACFEAAPPAEAVVAVTPPAAEGAEALAEAPTPPAGAPAGPLRVRIDWLTGVGARDWAEVAKKDHLLEVSATLVELEAELASVYGEMLKMRTREEEMRNTSERVNAKVAWMSVCSLAVSCSLAAWQVVAMKAFFTKKKLI